MSIKNSLETIRKWDSNSSEIRVGFFDKVYFLPKTKPNASFLKKSITKTSRFVSKFFHEGLWFGRKSNKQKLLALYKKIALNKNATFEQTEVIVAALDKHINIFNKKITSLHSKTKTIPNKRQQLEKKEQNKKALLEQFILLKKELVKEGLAKLQKDFPVFAPALEPSNNLEEIIENVEKINLPDQETSKKQLLQKLHTLQQHEANDGANLKTDQESLSQLKEQFPQFQEAFDQSKSVEEVIEKAEKIQAPGQEDAKVQLLEKLRTISENVEEKSPSQPSGPSQHSEKEIHTPDQKGADEQSQNKAEKDTDFSNIVQQLKVTHPQFQEACNGATNLKQLIRNVEKIKIPNLKESKQRLLMNLKAHLQKDNEKIKVYQLKGQFPQFNNAFAGAQSLTKIIENLEQINIPGQETSKQQLLEELNLLQRKKRFSPEGYAIEDVIPYLDDGRFAAGEWTPKSSRLWEWSLNVDKVESIDLHFNAEQHDVEKIAENIKKSPNLKNININLHHRNELKILEEAILEKKDLKSLKILHDSNFKFTDSFLKKLLKQSPNLEKLGLTTDKLTEEGFETLRQFSNLQRLELSLGRTRTSPFLVEELKKGFPTIESLSISYAAQPKAYDSVISNIKNYPKLKCLELDHRKAIPILKKLPPDHQIEELKVCVTAISKDIDPNYSQIPEVWRGAAAKGIQKLIGELRNLGLKKLTIIGVESIEFGHEGYEALEHLKTLEYLEIPYPSTGDGLKIITRLIQILPNLRTLYIQPIQVQATLKKYPEKESIHSRIEKRRIPSYELAEIRKTFESRLGFVIEEVFLNNWETMR